MSIKQSAEPGSEIFPAPVAAQFASSRLDALTRVVSCGVVALRECVRACVRRGVSPYAPSSQHTRAVVETPPVRGPASSLVRASTLRTLAVVDPARVVVARVVNGQLRRLQQDDDDDEDREASPQT